MWGVLQNFLEMAPKVVVDEGATEPLVVAEAPAVQEVFPLSELSHSSFSPLPASLAPQEVSYRQRNFVPYTLFLIFRHLFLVLLC